MPCKAPIVIHLERPPLAFLETNLKCYLKQLLIYITIPPLFQHLLTLMIQ